MASSSAMTTRVPMCECLSLPGVRRSSGRGRRFLWAGGPARPWMSVLRIGAAVPPRGLSRFRHQLAEKLVLATLELGDRDQEPAPLPVAASACRWASAYSWPASGVSDTRDRIRASSAASLRRPAARRARPAPHGPARGGRGRPGATVRRGSGASGNCTPPSPRHLLVQVHRTGSIGRREPPGHGSRLPTRVARMAEW